MLTILVDKSINHQSISNGLVARFLPLLGFPCYLTWRHNTPMLVDVTDGSLP